MPDQGAETLWSGMTLNDLSVLITSALRRLPHHPGLRVHLRSIDELGFQRLMRLVELLAPNASHPLVLGFYRFGYDTGPRRFFGEPASQLTLTKDTELDWHLWTATASDLLALEAAISWPDLVVDGHGQWLIWTEDNTSFLCDLRG